MDEPVEHGEHIDSRRAAWSGDLEGELPWMQELACHLVRDRDAARELVQDAWLQALERPPEMRDRPRAWISTVMRNLVRQVGRRKARRGRVVSDGDELADVRPQPSYVLERVELEALLKEELRRLAEPYRTTLRDHFLRDLTSAEIARQRGVPAGTVRWRLKVGLDRLRERLDEHSGGPSGWRAVIVLLLPPAPTPAGRAPLPRPASLSLAGLGVVATGTALYLLGGAGDGARTRGVATETALAQPAAPVEALRTANERERGPLGPGPETSLVPEPASAAVAATLLVVRDEDGRPLAGAEVAVHTPAGFVALGRSDEAGQLACDLAALPTGTTGIPAAKAHVALRAAFPGRAHSEVLFVPSTWTGAEPLQLVLDEPARVLRGLVLDGQDRPVAGAEVFALRDPSNVSLARAGVPFDEPLPITTLSGETGAFELVGVGYRHLALGLRRPGEEARLMPLDAETDAAGEDLLRLRVPEGGTVRGLVLDEQGRPARARVWIEPVHRGTEWCTGSPGYEPELCGWTPVATTDAEGRFELRGVQARTRRMYAQSLDDPALAVSEPVVIAPRGETSWNVFLTRPSGLDLSLVDPDGKPRAGWLVHLVAQRGGEPRWVRRLTADATGRVCLLGVPGSADLSVYPPDGLGPPWLTKQVLPQDSTQVLVIDDSRFGLLAGRLLDAGGRPPKGARVDACASGARMAAPIPIDPATGRFRARVEPGEHELVLRSENGGAPLRRVQVGAGERTTLGILEMPDLGELRLRADRQGERRESYRLMICFSRSVTTWREAPLPLLATESVHAGLYRLDAFAADGVGVSAWASVRAGEVSELDLERLASVRVEVAPRGKDGSVLLLVEPEGSEPDPDAPERAVRVTRRVDGRFVHVLELPPGTWRITAQGDSSSATQSVLVPPTGTSLVALQMDD
ncbi:MAG TPA: sigma-70 family RNA polymerase sigma factor [Planctomycetota bacterium]